MKTELKWGYAQAEGRPLGWLANSESPAEERAFCSLDYTSESAAEAAMYAAMCADQPAKTSAGAARAAKSAMQYVSAKSKAGETIMYDEMAEIISLESGASAMAAELRNLIAVAGPWLEANGCDGKVIAAREALAKWGAR